MLRQFADGESFEDGQTEGPLPAVFQDAASEGREEPVVAVEKTFLSGIFDLPHGRRNCFNRLGFSIKLRPHDVKRKMIINSYSRVT